MAAGRRSRSRSAENDPTFRRSPPAPGRPSHAPIVCYNSPTYFAVANVFIKAPNPSSVLGIFGLSIRTTERDLDDEFGRFGRVDKVVIVYDQRVCATLFASHALSDGLQSGRSRGFGFITMATVDDAARCIKEMNGVVCLISLTVVGEN